MTEIALLDVNVLVALFDVDHVHHEAAHREEHRPHGWATCPLTENGLIRILSNPAYSGAEERPAQIAQRLQKFCASGQHVFWADTVSLRDPKLFRLNLVGSHRQVADVYLLGPARKRGGRLATFDRRIPSAAVIGTRSDHLTVIAA